MNSKSPSYHGYRFPPEIISHAVWLYHRFCMSFRDVEDLLAQRGITASFLDSARRLGHHGRRFLHSTWARRSTIGVRLHMRRTASSSFPRILLVCVLVNGPAGVSHAEPAEVYESARHSFRVVTALLHGPEQIADLPVPVAESPGAVRIGHPERSHLVEYLAPNSVFNSLPRQRSSPHLRPDDRLVTIDRVLHHASLGVA